MHPRHNGIVYKYSVGWSEEAILSAMTYAVSMKVGRPL